MENKLLSIGALVISVVALGASMKSCSVAQKAFVIQEKQHEASFRTVWVGNYDEKSKTISIKPSNEKVTLLRAKAYYPEEISKQEWPIEAPEYRLYLTSPIITIEKKVEKRVPKKKGHIIMLDDSRIPVVIESYYTVDGNNYFEKSLYSLEYNAIIREEKWKDPFVKINGLLFNQRLDVEVEPRKYLNEIWSKKALNK